jgi:hypothetical protein
MFDPYRSHIAFSSVSSGIDQPVVFALFLSLTLLRLSCGRRA